MSAPGGPMRAVCIGGGTGQPHAIRALHGLGCHVSAIVSMVDDGGSTGILRRRTGMIPPGDVRKCLVAMADPSRAELAAAFEHRFSFADGHALGNLLMCALASETGSFERALHICSELLGCYGEVLPSTLDDVALCGLTRDGVEFRGQATLGTGPCALSRVWLSPREPSAYEPAVRAIEQADVVVLGPGSLFTSIIPNILVEGIREALINTSAQRIYVCSLADMQGETWGLTAEEHIQALFDHGLEGAIDTVLLHRPAPHDMGVPTRCFQAITSQQAAADARLRAESLEPNTDCDPDPDWYFRPVHVDDASAARIRDLVPNVVVRDFADANVPAWHDNERLASALAGVMGTCRSPQA